MDNTFFTAPMAWWYWFGMWVALLTSIFLVFWAFLDVFRSRKGSPHAIQQFIWPTTGLIGIFLQLPALFIRSTDAKISSLGTSMAVLGIAGTVLLGIATIALFSKASSEGRTFFSLTKDINSKTSTGSRNRNRRDVGGTMIPVPSDASRKRRTATPLPYNTSRSAPADDVDTQAKQPANTTIPEAKTEETVADDHPPNINSNPGSGTMMLGATGTLTVEENVEQTLIEDETAHTILDEPEEPASLFFEESATIIDEPEFEAHLLVVDGKSDQIIVNAKNSSFVVGRDSARCTFAINDSKVSRRHFAIDDSAGIFLIEDLGSSNGTFVNGEKVKGSLPLHNDDIIEFGRTRAKFQLHRISENHE